MKLKSTIGILLTTSLLFVVVGITYLNMLTNNNSGQSNSDVEYKKNHMSLVFFNDVVEIEKADSGNTEYTFWNKQIQNTDNSELFAYVFKNFDVDSFIYDQNLGIYYLLQPGGYEQIRLVKEDEITMLSKSTSARFQDVVENMIVVNEREKVSTDNYGQVAGEWIAVKYTDYYVESQNLNDSKENWGVNGYNVFCYVPVKDTNWFLEFSTPVKPIGSEIDMCQSLINLGIVGAVKK